jgi:predicted esterase
VASVFLSAGPFDGVLGFSQGAAMALLLCALQSLRDTGAAATAEVADDPITSQLLELAGPIRFRFVLLCSGFVPPVPALAPLLRVPLALPALVLLGTGDRQTHGGALSEAAAAALDAAHATVLRHDMGHVIPTAPVHVVVMRAFLARQQRPAAA